MGINLTVLLKVKSFNLTVLLNCVFKDIYTYIQFLLKHFF